MSELKRLLFSSLRERVVHFRWLEGKLIQGAADRVWDELYAMLDHLDQVAALAPMKPLIALAKAVDKDGLEMTGWEDLCSAIEDFDIKDGPARGIRVDRVWSGYFYDSDGMPGRPFEPILHTTVTGGETFNVKGLCKRVGPGMIGGPARPVSPGKCRQLGDVIATAGLSELMEAQWNFEWSGTPARAARNTGMGELRDTISMLISTSVHIALRNTARRRGLPLPIHIILTNDGEAPEFSSPVVTAEEFQPRNDETSYFALPSEPEYCEPKIWSGPIEEDEPEPRQFMLAQLMSQKRVPEHNEIDTNPDGAFIAREVRLRFIQDHVEETYEEKKARRREKDPLGIGVPFNFGGGIKPEQAEAAADFVLRNVLRTDNKRMQDPALREAVRLFGDIFRK